MRISPDVPGFQPFYLYLFCEVSNSVSKTKSRMHLPLRQIFWLDNSRAFKGSMAFYPRDGQSPKIQNMDMEYWVQFRISDASNNNTLTWSVVSNRFGPFHPIWDEDPNMIPTDVYHVQVESIEQHTTLTDIHWQ